MDNTVNTISFFNLLFAFIPVFIVLSIIWKWRLNYKNAAYAVVRMLLQLLLIGYVLVYIFEADNDWIVIGVLSLMLAAAAWISLRTMSIPLRKVYLFALAAILIGGVSVLLLITQLVIDLDPWYQPSYMIPLAGMIFANAMNCVSLAGERLESELNNHVSYDKAKSVAFQASLIPTINALFAVGLVSLPGMMTGQILSGVSPFIAARYQIMVMCMVFGASGISSALFLHLIKPIFQSNN